MYMVEFFFNDTATTEIYTLSLLDALPIFLLLAGGLAAVQRQRVLAEREHALAAREEAEAQRHQAERQRQLRSEEHTSELQSRQYLVCRLLLEKKNRNEQEHTRRTSHPAHR